MTGPADEGLDGLRRFAALSGRFDPGEALDVVVDSQDPTLLVDLASGLSTACDTAPDTWLMRGPERRWELGVLAGREPLTAAVAWRRGVGTVGEDTADLLDALTGAGPFTRTAVEAAVAAAGPRRLLERLAEGLDRAGPPAPAWPVLDDVRAALTRLEVRERRERVTADFAGRDPELAVVADWLASTPRPVVACLFVCGPPGIGKTTLLAEGVRRAVDGDPRWLPVRLDFDRAGLDVRDERGLTLELARQVTAGLAERVHELREARLVAAGGGATPGLEPVKGDDLADLPMDLVMPLAQRVRAAGRRPLLVLDTLEVLRGRGETHPQRLLAWIDRLAGLGLGPPAVVAAGRGDALDSVTDRIGRRVDLPGLDPAAADRMLAALDVPAEARAAARELADGNPLVLRLAAAVVREASPAALASAARRRSAGAEHLYRFLLSRIPDPTLRRLANPSLVVRRISAELISEVLAPQVGLGRLTPSRGADLFAALAEQHWLVHEDPQAPGFLTHRPDLRRPLLRLLHTTSPTRCARIDRAAAAWFARRTEPWCAIEEAYHRLQLLRPDDASPAVDLAVLRGLDEDTVAELPEHARDLVRRARGERTSVARSAETVDIRLAAGEIEALLAEGDPREAAAVFDQTLNGAPLDPRSAEAAVVRALFWRTGRWREARRMLADAGPGGGGPRSATVAAAHLEMRAEWDFAALAEALRDPAAALPPDDGTGMSDGPLGFARLVAAQPVSTAGVPAAVLAEWSSGPSDPSAEGTAWARWSADPPAPPDAATARLWAARTPYARIAAAWVRTAPVSAYAGAVLAALNPSSSDDAITALAAAGLFAEWAGAAAVRFRDPDLALLARGAERWRRTTAGAWSYPRRPGGWVGRRPVDVTVADRIAGLRATTDPPAAARAALTAWSESPDRLAHRYAGALAAARTTGAEAAAAVLLRHRVPTAFVPALAVLAVPEP